MILTTRMDKGQTIPHVDSDKTIGQAVDHQSWMVRCFPWATAILLKQLAK